MVKLRYKIKGVGEYRIMIETVLDAYEEKIAEKSTFIKKLAKLDKITKILFWGIIISAITISCLTLLMQSQAMLITMIIYVVIINILTLILEKVHHRKWETNLKEYNEELNIIAEIIKGKDFNLYEKNKIKQIICKYYQSIEQQETRNAKKNSDLKDFICTYIVPMMAFFAGKINITDSSDIEWFAIGIVIIIVAVSGKYICSSIVELVEMISWNHLEKERHFVLKLQDLLDRDFTIEQNDLLSLK